MILCIINDGGRRAAGFKGYAGDCAVRAVAIAAEMSYRVVYDGLFDVMRDFVDSRPRNRIARGMKSRGFSPRSGVHTPILKQYLAALGWEWTTTMGIGTGCTVHLDEDELPDGRLICRVSKHYCAVLDGVLHDTHDCSRGGTRCVYGYWSKGGA